ncbi:Hypothetical predicted protein [Paramuricea clavata]|uniref:Uncharacterized protein n=1 Tax=Paramuricea clavata TaxID=317549 RepID=A0A7D9ITJ6_PARCT|nr:Hypothetical predicted protein [Paramuricea clavata]
MFCHICGVETPNCSNVCWKCGASVKSKKAEEDKKKPVSFMAFKKRKEEERFRFQPKKKVKVGKQFDINGEGKRGYTITVTADRKTILERSVHNSEIVHLPYYIYKFQLNFQSSPPVMDSSIRQQSKISSSQRYITAPCPYLVLSLKTLQQIEPDCPVWIPDRKESGTIINKFEAPRSRRIVEKNRKKPHQLHQELQCQRTIQVIIQDQNLERELYIVNVSIILLNSSTNTTLPGTTEQFVLNKYREDVGRNYNRITIFIATKTDYINYHLFEIGENLEAESSDNNHGSEDDDDRIINETVNNAHSSQHDRRLRQAKWKQTTLEEVSGPSTCSTFPSACGDEQRPSTSNTLPSTHDGDEQRQSSVEHHIECPSCFKIFPVNEIAEHADKCVDIWIGEVQEEDSENESETDTDLPDPGFIDAKPADTSLKNVAQQL